MQIWFPGETRRYFPSVKLKLNFLEGFAGNIWTGGRLVGLHSFCCATRIPAAAVWQIVSQNEFLFVSCPFFICFTLSLSLFNSLWLCVLLILSPVCTSGLTHFVLFSWKKNNKKWMRSVPVYKPHSDWCAVIKRAKGFIVRWIVSSLCRRPQFAALLMLNS